MRSGIWCWNHPVSGRTRHRKGAEVIDHEARKDLFGLAVKMASMSEKRQAEDIVQAYEQILKAYEQLIEEPMRME
jgi:hypothetical protein